MALKKSSILFILVVLGALILVGCGNKAEELTDTPEVNEELVVQLPEIETTPSKSSGETKSFQLTGKSFRFYMDGQESPDLKVKQGDTVRVEFTSEQGFHDFMISEFNAATEKVMAGNTTSVEFLADKKGTFEYYCSVGTHRQQGMKGNFIVE